MRLAVYWTDPAADFLNDSAFHWRMVNAVVTDGHVPEPDGRSDPPAGRDVARLLPLGLYASAAAFHAALGAVGARDLRFNVLLFVALAGGLVALPVWAGARALFGSGWAPVAAAFLAALNPAHLHRTYAYWLRYDALGTLFLVAHLAFALRALGGRRVWVESGLSALCLLAAMATWRVALAIPVIEIAFVLVWAIARGAPPALRIWYLLQAVALLVAGVSIPYLRAIGFGFSPPVLATTFLALALKVPWARGARGARAAVLVGAVALAWVVSRIVAPAGVVGEQFAILPARLGLAPARSPWLALQLLVEESRAASLRELFGPGFLSWSAPWFFAAPFFLRRRLDAAAALFAVFAVGVTALTLLFARDKVLLGPVAAVALGGLLFELGPRRWIAAALAVCLAVTAYDAVQIAISRRSEPEPAYAAAIRYLAEHSPPGSTILSPWEFGYDLQAYAGRATATDGLLEAPVNQRRIAAFARAAFAPAPDSLLALARETNASYLLVPPSDRLYGLALVAGVPFRDKLATGRALEPAEAQGVLVQMSVLGRSYSGVEKELESGSYRVYRVR